MQPTRPDKLWTSIIIDGALGICMSPVPAPRQAKPAHVAGRATHPPARGLKAASINPIIGALRFFCGTTLVQKALAEQIHFARKEDTLAAVLSQDQVVRLWKAEPNLKMRTAFTTIYAAVLRVSEVVALTTLPTWVLLASSRSLAPVPAVVPIGSRRVAFCSSPTSRRRPRSAAIFAPCATPKIAECPLWNISIGPCRHHFSTPHSR